MLTGLSFEIAEPRRSAGPGRADVVCFVGFVPRRGGSPLSEGMLQRLRESGWIGGPWNVGRQRVEDLLDLPVVVDSWADFDRLFAWEARPIRGDGDGGVCASPTGAAVRSFFDQGGRRAVVIRVGDPWPVLGGPDRPSARPDRLGSLLSALGPAPRPFAATDPAEWRGVEHIYGLPEVSFVCLPDLPDICSTARPAPEPAIDLPDPPERFVECSEDEPAPAADGVLLRVAAPRLDAEGFRAWTRSVHEMAAFLAGHRRDALLLASLPLADGEARAGADSDGVRASSDWLAFLGDLEVLNPGSMADSVTAGSAFVQLVWPWLRTSRSGDLPEGLEGGEGLLAGRIAHNALARGTYRSTAGVLLPEIVSLEPTPDAGLGPNSTTARLARRVCVIGHEPDGPTLLSDVTSSPDPAWRDGGVSRIMALILRTARRVGQAHLFDANGPETWRQVRRAMEDLLDGFVRAGALQGSGPEAYSVRCDRSTMTQDDLDAGRLRAEVTVRPASAIEHITVSLELSSGGVRSLVGEVA